MGSERDAKTDGMYGDLSGGFDNDDSFLGGIGTVAL